MKLFINLTAFLFFSTLLNAQVGINNTDPKASLDISATNQATPSNTDGLLIPRIDDFPASNPAAAQQGMMVYLTTTSGANSPGFYYWDNGSTSWISALGVDDDWTDVGADIERQSGNVYIGDTNTTNNDLYLSDRIIDWDATTYYLDPDDISKIDEIEFDAGSIVDPSIRFSDTDTGFYSPSAATTAYSANGTEAFRINNTGDISIGNTSNLNYKLLIENPVSASNIYI